MPAPPDAAFSNERWARHSCLARACLARESNSSTGWSHCSSLIENGMIQNGSVEKGRGGDGLPPTRPRTAISDWTKLAQSDRLCLEKHVCPKKARLAQKVGVGSHPGRKSRFGAGVQRTTSSSPDHRRHWRLRRSRHQRGDDPAHQKNAIAANAPQTS